MNTKSKLKPLNSNGYIYGTLAGIIFIVIIAIIWKQFGEGTVDMVAGIVMSTGAVLNLIVWIRTRNQGFMIYFLWPALMGTRLLCGWTDPRVIAVYAATVILLVVLFFYMLIKKKLVWHYRHILELAAKPVTEIADGFSSRPYPAGKAEFTKDEIIGFGKYLAKHLIAFPYLDDNGLVLVLSRNEMLDLLFTRRNYNRDTYISFGFEGNMNVHIARKEYDIYQEEFTFDQLCQSLGDQFLTFLTLYQQGEHKRILAILHKIH